MSDAVLVEPRLQVPARLRPLVSRLELVDRLRIPEIDLALVVAPAGYGKTTLLTEIVAADDRAHVWLSLDPADNDPAVLMAALIGAFDDVERVDAPTGITLEWFTRLLAGRTVPMVIALDDVHALAEPAALDVLGALAAGSPASSTVVLAGRTMPAVKLGRLRVHRSVVEVGMGDLALDAGRTGEFLRSMGVPVAPADVQRLVDTTEGWPAILYLAAVWLQRQDDVGRAVEQFAGDHRLVVDYVRDEMLDDLHPDVSSFLLGASCLERLSGPLCDTALDRSGSAALLERLERANIMVLAVDDRRVWYRLHNLLIELLQVELRRRHPDRALAIHRRASEWFEANNDPDRAIRHAMHGGDAERAETLIMQHFGAFATTGRHSTIVRWLGMFTESQLSTRPLLSAVAGYARLAAGDGAGALHWLRRAELALPERNPPGEHGWSPAVAVATQRATFGRVSAEQMAADARYGHERAPCGSWHALACLVAGAAEFMLDHVELAEELLTEGAAEADVSSSPNVHAMCLAHLAVVAIEGGDWGRATDLGRRGRALLRQAGLEHLANMFLVTAVSALVEARAGQTDAATADRLVTRRNLAGFARAAPWANLQARVALARANILLGDRLAARTRLDEADVMIGAIPDAVRVRAQLADVRRLLASAGRIDDRGPSALTIAELRVLQYLPTHLTLADISDRLYVSRNTVKSQTVSIYRKLGASSRGAAVDAAWQAGLFDDPS